ncbi:hypothetical protein [uncultured Shewanella sp.]|uniref:hypothetical protein n=1 Tax=uncultured Shewanella sp. TaxID=173975 RepID=UPI00260DE2A0|nr:hypothetical protein [uncultured Shewanella sp.]
MKFLNRSPLYVRTQYSRHRQSQSSASAPFKTTRFSASVIAASASVITAAITAAVITVYLFPPAAHGLILDDFLDDSDSGSQVKHTLPIFSQELSFNLSGEWRLAFNQQQAGMYAAEFVPSDQQLSSWSSLFCVQGFEGLSDNIEPEAFIDSLATAYAETCEGEVIYNKLGESEVDGLEGFSAILACTRMPDTHRATRYTATGITSVPQGEIGHYTAISGVDDLYLLHQSRRGELFSADDPPMEWLKQNNVMSAISPVRLSR